MKVKTSCGFSWEINENKVKDWRFAKALAKCDSDSELGAIDGITFMVPFLFGEDGEAALMELLMDKDGIVPSAKVIEVLKEVLKQIKDANTKKS